MTEATLFIQFPDSYFQLVSSVHVTHVLT